MISPDDDGKAYLCAKKTQSCYDTSKTQYLPPRIDDATPLYNVTAWAENLATCGGAPEEPIDTFCDYSGTQVARPVQMTDVFNAYVLTYTDSPSPDADPVVATLKDFRQSSYQMRQSPLGYACLPVGSSGTVGARPQGYRYVSFPLDEDADKKTCTMVDCLNVALSHDVQNVYYNDDNHACMAVVCEGDGCTSMVPPSSSPSGPSQKLASRDADGPYCKKPTGGLDAFKTDNCPKEITYDCLPDYDQDGAGNPDVTKVYEQNGLQFWKPGQRDVNFCVTNNMADGVCVDTTIESNPYTSSCMAWCGTSNVWPTYCDKSPPGRCNEQVDTAGVQPLHLYDHKCLTKNVLDYLDRRVWLTAQGNFMGHSAYQGTVENSQVDSISVREDEDLSSYPPSFSRNIYWHMNDQPNCDFSGNWSAGVCKYPEVDKC